jgi:hypothetical protein
MTGLQLTPYDEFPVHQAPYPFSYIPSTDYTWCDGYYFGVFSPDDQVFLATGIRVNPNSDMIGGYALLNVAGRQHTFRFSRSWRRDFSLAVGPYRVEVLEPMKRLRLVLEPNESGQSFDIVWEGVSPPYEEEHHIAVNRGRRTTDQTRYSQPGTCSGFIELDGRRWEVTPGRWNGARDHSWGLYMERPPLGPDKKWLPPSEHGKSERAFRLWTCFNTPPFSGFFHLHEDAEGRQRKMNDVFGIPFGGTFYKGWSEPIAMVAARHEVRLVPGTRLLKQAEVFLTDSAGGEWRQLFEAVSPPWIVATMGYNTGSWKDGGNVFSYHGSEELATEWDDFDFSQQPVRYVPYGVKDPSQGDGHGVYDSFAEPIYGVEYGARVTTWAPDGTKGEGSAQFEMFISPPYHPLGIE